MKRLNEYSQAFGDSMTRKELRIAIDSAKEILEMLDEGMSLERWQISALVKASDELSSVRDSMSADRPEYDEPEYDSEDDYPYSSMYGESVKEDMDYAVEIEGLPKIYMRGKSPMDIKAILRKVIKKTDMVQNVERTTKSQLRKAFMLKARGKDDEEIEQ